MGWGKLNPSFRFQMFFFFRALNSLTVIGTCLYEKEAAFVSDWLTKKGLQKLCSIFRAWIKRRKCLSLNDFRLWWQKLTTIGFFRSIWQRDKSDDRDGNWTIQSSKVQMLRVFARGVDGLGCWSLELSASVTCDHACLSCDCKLIKYP